MVTDLNMNVKNEKNRSIAAYTKHINQSSGINHQKDLKPCVMATVFSGILISTINMIDFVNRNTHIQKERRK